MRIPSRVCIPGVVLIALISASQSQVIAQSRSDTASVGAPRGQAGAPSWGPSSLSTLNISAWAFEAENGGLATFNSRRFSSVTDERVFAPFTLPTGAVILFVQIVACDTSATNAIVFHLAAMDTLGTVTALTPDVNTGATPGCGVFANGTTGHVVNNTQNTYFIEMRSVGGGATSANSYIGARVIYGLQASAAPGTATFADVPVGHPFHRFVEALAASGITGGCGGGNYCPDAPLTRGQMAVFLAAALGLHFPN